MEYKHRVWRQTDILESEEGRGLETQGNTFSWEIGIKKGNRLLGVIMIELQP